MTAMAASVTLMRRQERAEMSSHRVNMDYMEYCNFEVVVMQGYKVCNISVEKNVGLY